MRSVFVGTGGFLGQIFGETRCAFWTDEPVDHNFDPQRLITVDLARTPSAAASGEIKWEEYAEVLEERGTLARVTVYPPGSSQRRGVRPLTMWIDLLSPEHCDAGPDALTEIGTGDAPKRGALFLIAGQL